MTKNKMKKRKEKKNKILNYSLIAIWALFFGLFVFVLIPTSEIQYYTEDTLTRSFESLTPQINTPVLVSLILDIVKTPSEINIVVVEDIPAGTSDPSEISNNGAWDATNRKIRWLIQADSPNTLTDMTLSYKLSFPTISTYVFSGHFSFGGGQEYRTIAGSTSVSARNCVTEICDGVDNDCDSQVDEGVKNTYYQDTDSDSYGSSSVTSQACSAPTGYVATSGDCNDNNAAIKPSATEVCDGVDNNCNSQIDEGGNSLCTSLGSLFVCSGAGGCSCSSTLDKDKKVNNGNCNGVCDLTESSFGADRKAGTGNCNAVCDASETHFLDQLNIAKNDNVGNCDGSVGSVEMQKYKDKFLSGGLGDGAAVVTEVADSVNKWLRNLI